MVGWYLVAQTWWKTLFTSYGNLEDLAAPGIPAERMPLKDGKNWEHVLLQCLGERSIAKWINFWVTLVGNFENALPNMWNSKAGFPVESCPQRKRGEEDLWAQPGTALPRSCGSNPSPKSFRRKQLQRNKLRTGAASAIKTPLKKFAEQEN